MGLVYKFILFRLVECGKMENVRQRHRQYWLSFVKLHPKTDNCCPRGLPDEVATFYISPL